MNDNNNSSSYFIPGEVVRIKKEKLEFAPLMIVESKAEKDNHLIGINCMWFTMNFELQRSVFNTKDLEKVTNKLK